MTSPNNVILAGMVTVSFLVVATRGDAHSSLAVQSTPEVRVLVYSFRGLSSRAVQEAEIQAARVLHPASIDLKWIDCNSPGLPASCIPSQVSGDLVVRFLPKALPQASTRALAISRSSGEYATAFIFCDRIFALRTSARPVPTMLGRVLAHEITHLLASGEGHAEFGLMRGDWSTDDLRIGSRASMGLSNKLVHLIEKEALRRMMVARRLAGISAPFGTLPGPGERQDWIPQEDALRNGKATKCHSTMRSFSLAWSTGGRGVNCRLSKPQIDILSKP